MPDESVADFCASCGAQNTAKKQFCPECGASLVKINKSSAVSPPQNTTSKMGSKNATLLIVAGIVIAIIGGILLMSVIQTEKSASTSRLPSFMQTTNTLHDALEGPQPTIPQKAITPTIMIFIGVAAIAIGVYEYRKKS